MSDEDKMTINERRKYLRMVIKRYNKAGKADRGLLLDEMEAVTGLHRKSLVRLMASNLKRKARRRHGGRQYGTDVDVALRVISESSDHSCMDHQSVIFYMLSHCFPTHVCARDPAGSPAYVQLAAKLRLTPRHVE